MMKLFLTICLLHGLMISSVEGKMSCTQDKDHIVITNNGHHVLTYHKTARAPQGVDPKYARSGFIHPISTPTGRILTDDYPVPHHSHQHGLFFAWRKATFEGEELNFWEPGNASIRHEKVLNIFNGENTAGFEVELSHRTETKPILREIWTVMVDGRTGFIDMKSAQSCVTRSPITLEKFHYGGMAIRGSRQWFEDAHTTAGKGATKDEFIEACKMLTNEGLTQANGNHSRPTWVSMAGRIDSAPVSITLIPHPTNFRYPQHVRLHPKMPYFCFIPTVEKSFQIKPGQTWTSRYRIIVKDEEPKPEILNAIQSAFAAEE